MHWTYADVLTLPQEIYVEAVKFVNEELTPKEH